jgi:pyruvate ferredoxin oxidoreductase gamma subunit
MAELLEVRWHGRGGLGAVTSAELLARAAAGEGKFTDTEKSYYRCSSSLGSEAGK